MKKYLSFATIILMISSCNSGNSKTGSFPDSSLQSHPTNYENLKKTDLNRIGDLSLGMVMKTIVEKIGLPESKSKEEIWDADGWLHQDWEYPSKGVILNMSSETESSSMEVFSINITHPCTFKTNKNIGLGNNYEEVMAAYKNEIDTTSSNENVIVVGSLYGGIIIEFKEKKVVKIFIGAAAE